MVMMSSGLNRRLALRILEILLNRGKVLLRRRHISSLQVLRQLIESLRDWIIADACAAASSSVRTGSGLQKRRSLLQCHEIALRLRQISRLQILAQLLKFLLKLFEF